ncbi:thiol-disulfide oxidoreductase DCC family protein [Thermaerobacter litoralis]
MERLIVYYDGWCPWCTRAARWCRRLDWLNRLELCSFRPPVWGLDPDPVPNPRSGAHAGFVAGAGCDACARSGTGSGAGAGSRAGSRAGPASASAMPPTAPGGDGGKEAGPAGAGPEAGPAGGTPMGGPVPGPPPLDPERAAQAEQALLVRTWPSGRWHQGFEAVRAIARRLPLLWPVVPVLALLDAVGLGPALYGFVARRRPVLIPVPGPCPLPRSGGAGGRGRGR